MKLYLLKLSWDMFNLSCLSNKRFIKLASYRFYLKLALLWDFLMPTLFI